MSDDTSARRSMENPHTCILRFGDASVERRQPLGPRESFLVAYDRLALLASVVRGPAVVVAAVDPSARVVESLVLQDRHALVMGRHTRCGLRLSSESVSLRHVAALLRFEDDRPILRLWDLRTGIPFVTEDRRPAGAIITDGPLYAAIDTYALWFVSARGPWPAGPKLAWDALPARTFLDRQPPEVHCVACAPHLVPPDGTPPAGVRVEHKSTITRLGPPMLIGEGDEPEIGWGVIRVEGGGLRERRTVSAERLGRGVLVGRYERCGVTIPVEGHISRVHLLLARIGVEVWAIDTASTNGVRRGAEPLSAEVLRDTDSLSLAYGVTLDWRRLVHPEA